MTRPIRVLDIGNESKELQTWFPWMDVKITPKFPTKIWNIAIVTENRFEEKKEAVDFDLGCVKFELTKDTQVFKIFHLRGRVEVLKVDEFRFNSGRNWKKINYNSFS